MIFIKTAFPFVLSIQLSLSFSFSQNTGKGPFELNTGKEAVIIGAGTAIGLTALLVVLNNDKLTEAGIDSIKPQDVNKFDRIAIGSYQDDVLGDALLYGSYLLPLTFLTYDETREDFGTLALMYGEVFLLNKGINALIKGLTTRNRPFVYDADSPIEEKHNINARHSFYSGHTSITASNAFFTARVFSEYLTNSTAKTLIWTAAALIPAVTGFSRVNTHNHFPTDVIVGYIVGAAIGYLIPELHEYENQNSEPVITNQIIYKPIFGFQISF